MAATNTKESIPLEDYVNKVKNLFANILVVEDELSTTDQVMYALRGLNFDYNSPIINITQQRSIPFIEEVFNHVNTRSNLRDSP